MDLRIIILTEATENKKVEYCMLSNIPDPHFYFLSLFLYSEYGYRLLFSVVVIKHYDPSNL